MKLEVTMRTPTGEPRPTPLLFVHGADPSTWVWVRHFLPFFADRGYEAHALSLRGHGASEGHELLKFCASVGLRRRRGAGGLGLASPAGLDRPLDRAAWSCRRSCTGGRDRRPGPAAVLLAPCRPMACSVPRRASH